MSGTEKATVGRRIQMDGYFGGTVGKHGNEDTTATYVKNQGMEYQKLHEDYQLSLF